MLEILSEAVPELVSVIDEGGLTVFTTWSLKVRLLTEREIFDDPSLIRPVVPPPIDVPPPHPVSRQDAKNNRHASLRNLILFSAIVALFALRHSAAEIVAIHHFAFASL